MKQCSKCSQHKQLDMFYNDKRYSDNKYPSCKECKKTKLAEYYQTHREEVIKRDIARKTFKYANDLNYNLKHKLRSRLRSALKREYRSGLAIECLGCSIEEFKIYLESKFEEGMTWSNNTKYGWHIDHIQPLDGFDLTDQDQLKKACHYTNLQPLWAEDNLSKGNK